MKTDTELSELRQGISELFQKYSLHILIFLTALFFIITIANPATFFNDEWITLNQLRQLDQGHQIMYNEGTYGVFKNGTTTEYFDYRGQFLGYSLMLPLLSWPILKLFGVFGDQFRLFVLFFWALIPVLCILFIEFRYPKIARYRGLPWIKIIPVSMMGLFFLNLLMYYPYPFTSSIAPREAAAVVFTNEILFALMCALIFATFFQMFEKRAISIIATLVTVGSSSFIFWASNCKDHMLVGACFALCLYLMTRYVIRKELWCGIASFLSIGFLAWARPEVAAVVFILSVIFFIGFSFYEWKEKRDKKIFTRLLLPFFTLIGAIPFFINNRLITGNPLIPANLYYLTLGDEVAMSGVVSGVTGNTSLSVVGYTTPLIHKIFRLFSVDWNNLGPDLYGILYAPENGGAGVLVVSPIIALVFIFLIWVMFSRKFSVEGRTTCILIYYLFMIGAIFLAYIGSWGPMPISRGITPDMRYLSPVYLPIGILGMYLFNKIYPVQWSLKKTNGFIAGVFFSILGIILILFISMPPGASIYDIMEYFNALPLIFLVLIVFLLVFSSLINPVKKVICLVPAFLVISPLAWQIVLTFFFAAAKFNGYPFWIPIAELFYNNFVTVSM